MNPRFIVGAVFAALVVAALGWAWLVSAMNRPVNLQHAMVYDLAPGTSITGLARDLADRHVVDTPALAFHLYARLTRADGLLKAGEYRLTADMTTRDLLALFRSGKVVQRVITFVEGWTFAEWRRHLSTFDAIEHVSMAESDADIMDRLGKPEVDPEGQFFPDTYQYTRGESDLSILRRAHRRMMDTLRNEWARATRKSALPTRYDALILASIVEKETGYEPDRELIASVFLNRLARNMRLQSDPTVIYGLADDYKGDLVKSHLSEKTPYNTYVIRGLPPTPICNPGLASIRATMNAPPTRYLYFVARGDGSSEFSETLEQHNRAVVRFQKAGRVDDYRSTPAPAPKR